MLGRLHELHLRLLKMHAANSRHSRCISGFWISTVEEGFLLLNGCRFWQYWVRKHSRSSHVLVYQCWHSPEVCTFISSTALSSFKPFQPHTRPPSQVNKLSQVANLYASKRFSICTLTSDAVCSHTASAELWTLHLPPVTTAFSRMLGSHK